MNVNGEKHEVLGSTQEALKTLLKSRVDLPHLYYVMAEAQTAGRGRSDHTWVSAKGNLHVSILLRDLPFSEITWIPLWVSVCVHQALSELGVDKTRIQLKWPNDLWIERSKKTGGILCEKIGPSIVVGIGLNLVESPKLDQETGSISLISRIFPNNTVLDKILSQLALSTSVSNIHKIYQQYELFGEGDSIEWRQESSEKTLTGSVIGLDSHGELLVNCNGKNISLFAEDVRAARLN